MERHGGGVDVASRQGRAARFTLWFSVEQSGEQAAVGRRRTPHGEPQSVGFFGLRA